jgi:hypothetical protein
MEEEVCVSFVLHIKFFYSFIVSKKMRDRGDAYTEKTTFVIERF